MGKCWGLEAFEKMEWRRVARFLLKERRAIQSNANGYFICLIDVKAFELDAINGSELPIDLPSSCCWEDRQVQRIYEQG